MDERNGRREGPDALAEERGVGDEVAGDERSGRGVGAGASTFRGPGTPKRTARTVAPEASRAANFSGEQRLLLLDAWLRSKLAATECAELVGMTATTLYAWRRRFEEQASHGL